jgi:RNA polymerase sigma-70 factor (ECF subfamily)
MGARPVYDGAGAVAARFRGGARGARLTWVDGEPGLAWVAGDEVKVAFAFQVAGGRVREIELIADPEVLATMSLVVA